MTLAPLLATNHDTNRHKEKPEWVESVGRILAPFLILYVL